LLIEFTNTVSESQGKMKRIKELAIIILAAGKGKRMQSRLVKVLHRIAGLPMLCYPINAALALGAEKVIVVTGHQGERVKCIFGDEEIEYAFQKWQLGTGDAVRATEERLRDFVGNVLILCGDVPLIKVETLQRLVQFHDSSRSKVTVLTTRMSDATGYGRVVRDRSGGVVKIVEERDAGKKEKKITEINTGIYCMDAGFLFKALSEIGKENAQDEYYLTDVAAVAVRDGIKVSGLLVKDAEEVMGINDLIDLARADRIMRQRINSELMKKGVTLIDPETVYIDRDVKIGRDTVIYPACFIEGTTTVGEGCVIESGAMIVDSEIGNHVKVKSYSVIAESKVKDGASVGPFAHLRPGTVLEEAVKVGNFVEVKKSTIGKGSKASHLSYIGDTTMGEDVNVGAGTITCNYDGNKKHPTHIEDRVFIGSDTQFIAPVRVGRDSIIGAGSTITRNVPPGSLAVSRARQKNYKRVFAKKPMKKD